jgi:hypothetical protein
MKFKHPKKHVLQSLCAPIAGLWLTSFLCLTASSQAQVMPPGGYQGMMCPGLHDHRGLLRDPSVALSVKDIHDGVAIEWTSSDPQKVIALRQMGEQMQREHKRRGKNP